MTIRIAHLSDLHFGKKFDVDLWSALKQRVEASRSTLLFVTGDLVDHPSPLHLLAAKAELTALAKKMEAQLYVVAGNHDVYFSGLDTILNRRKDWFERIFYGGDTSEAETALVRELGKELGFSVGILAGATADSGARRLLKRAGILASFTDKIGPPGPKPFVIRPPDHKLLLALFDSNKPAKHGGLASGAVAHQDLVAIGARLSQERGVYLARVALIHHHVLPIAFTNSEDFKGSEQFMVLRNAGNVLALLAEHHFDLVLHGHHHRSQFARLDLSPEDASGYPIAVAAAGSASLRVKGDYGNCVNFITIGTSGQITVESVYYGSSKTPGGGRTHPT